MIKRATAFTLSFFLVFNTVIFVSAAQEKARTIEILSIEGSDVTMTKGAAKSFAAKKGMKLYDGYTVSTGANSYCYLKLDENSLTKIDKNSKIQISKTKSGGKLAISVLSGGLSVDAAQQKDGEAIEIRAGNSALAIRGTLFTAEYLPDRDFAIAMLSGSGSVDGNILVAGKTMLVYDVREDKLHEITELKIDSSTSRFVLETIQAHADELVEAGILTKNELENVQSLIDEKLKQEAEAQNNTEISDDVKRVEEETTRQPGGGGGGGTPPVTPAVNGVSVSSSSSYVKKGNSLQFSAAVSVTGGAAQTVDWSVDTPHHTDTTIDANGILTVNAGETATTLTIRATSTVDSSKSGTATVIPFTVTGVTVTPSNTNAAKGYSKQFTATVIGDGPPPQNVTWSVAGGISGTSISTSGLLTVDAGETAPTLTVTATATEDTSVSGTALVTVVNISVNISPSNPTVIRGGTLAFSADVNGGTDNTVIWSLIGSYVMGTAIDINTGVLTVAADETASSITVRATSQVYGGIYDEVIVIVPQVTGVTVSPNFANVANGSTHQFTATVAVTGGAAQTVNWSVDTPHHAGTTINANGLLSVSANETETQLTIRATSTANTSISGTATVTLFSVTGVTINPASLPNSLFRGDQQSFSAAVNGTGNIPQDVTWTVTGGSSSSIDTNGLLRIDANETSLSLTVRATSVADNTKFATVAVSVSPFAGGSGTPGDPYMIDRLAGLSYIRNGLNLCYVLTADINVSSLSVIGDNSTGLFKGVLDGDGHTLSNMTASNVTYQGLFASIDSSGTVKNLTISNFSSGNNNASFVGAIAGSNVGTIENCHVLSSTFSTTDSVGVCGGLVGFNGGTIRNCSSAANVSANNACGGLAGRSSGGLIEGCFATGSVQANHSQARAGGLVGYFGAGTIRNCYATGNVVCTGGETAAGGVVGYIALNSVAPTVEYCYSTSSISGSASCAGGIAGLAADAGSVNNCVALNGAIAGSSDRGYIIGYISSGVDGSGLYYKDSLSVTPGASSVNGASVASGYYGTDGTWWSGTVWSAVWNTYWTWDSVNNRPMLKWQQS